MLAMVILVSVSFNALVSASENWMSLETQKASNILLSAIVILIAVGLVVHVYVLLKIREAKKIRKELHESYKEASEQLTEFKKYMQSQTQIKLEEVEKLQKNLDEMIKRRRKQVMDLRI